MRGLTKAQQSLRDKLLRDSGFVDIEDEREEMKLARNGVLHGQRGRSSTLQEVQRDIETTAAYYQRAGQLLHEHPFRSPVDRRIWELHADGASYTRIWRTVKREIETGALPREKMYRRRVHAVVNRVRASMMAPPPKQAGRRKNPDSLRSQGLRLGLVLLTPQVALALDRIRQALSVSRAEAVRQGLMLLDRAIP